jgi:hypothetical protein
LRTNGARYEVAQIVRAHAARLQERHCITAEHKAVLRAIAACRTVALGGHLQVCERCGHQRPHYNSCRNRHCPKCQALAQHRWLVARTARILPVHHFHVVFTVPAELRALFLLNRSRLYALLFEAASQALLQLGMDPKRLGAQLGITAVLHTWRRDLGLHPHLHCVVTGGGLSRDAQRWVSTRLGFLFPVRVLAALFRGKFLDALASLNDRGQLKLTGACEPLADPREFHRLLGKLYTKHWVVYSKPPFGDARAVFAYLGRYTHRIAISNARLLDVSDHAVRFRTRHAKAATLHPVEFLRRLMLHVLPKGFVRIRHFGLLAPSNVPTKLEAARSLLAPRAEQPASPPPPPSRQPPAADRDVPDYIQLYRDLTGVDLMLCPKCGANGMHAQPLELRGRDPP